MKVAVFPGSFDPFTKGHEAIVRRALILFDKVIIAIGINSDKTGYFPVENRMGWIKDIFANESNVEVKITFQNPEEKNIIEADPLHMTELFLNILDNAYQALADKSGVIEITLGYDTKINKLNMAFSDNGVGIKDTDAAKVFEPFFTTKTRGVGLGLTVCKQVVDLHNGTININSQEAKGATVFVTLPIRKKL